MKITLPFSALASCRKPGSSAWHSAHQEAKKFTTTGLPR
jgi:hypothetical protein